MSSSSEPGFPGRVSYTSCSEDATLALARALGARLRAGDTVALVGGLGAGKTVFVRGLALGCGTSPETPVCSPTFTLAHSYPGTLSLHHLDLYRLSEPDELEAIGYRDYLAIEAGAVAVEWADRFPDVLPPDHVTVRLRIVDATRRAITLEGEGPRGRSLLRGVVEGAAGVEALSEPERG